MIQLETSEALFAVLAGINSCGYDQDLANADPLRAKVRAEIAAVVESSSAAATAREHLCRFYKDKQQADPSRDLAQYVSLGVFLTPPPEFGTTARESDLPPDAANVLGYLPVLRSFYEAAGLHRIWLRHHSEYEQRLERLHVPVSQMILRTDLYLKLPINQYLGRKFVVYIEPMGAHGQVNARNYSSDYFLVASPTSTGSLKMEQIRHTYLHYILDTLALKRANAIKRLDPLLKVVSSAPMDESFKNDTSLLVIESLIQAIEIRTAPKAKHHDDKATQNFQEQQVNAAMAQGYVLTRYFYDALVKFEQEPSGLRDEFTNMLNNIDVGRERKRAGNITFSSQAAPELVSASNSAARPMLDLAEEKLAHNDAPAAHRIAQQALDQQTDDPARAIFILARAAVLEKEMDDAQALFTRTLEVAHDPQMVGWSHIYLGRILDLKCSREGAITQYRAALSTADAASEIKAAANKGINELPPGCDQSSHKSPD